MVEHWLGIDIGGTKCAAALGDANGRIVAKRSVSTQQVSTQQGNAGGWRSTVDELVAAARAVLAANGIERPRAIGVSCGSPLDTERGIIEEPANLPGWKGVPIADILRREVADVPTFLENDANAGALAEFALGAGRAHACRHLVFLTFGTGLGAGLILDGRLYRGASGLAGEVGHVRLAPYGPAGCGKPGSFEGFCSGGGIAQIAHVERRAWFDETMLPRDGIETRDVGAAAERGDRLALRILEVSGEYLGRGLAILLDVLNPDLVVLGSVFARCERFLRPAMERTLRIEARRETLADCRIVPAVLAEDVGHYAALAIAYDRSGALDRVRGA